MLFSLTIAVVSVVSCSGTGNYGRLYPNDKVKNTFETYQLPSDYMYYYSGSDADPDVVIGIQNDYDLESKFWKPVALTQTLLKRWFQLGRKTRTGYNPDRNGSDILAPDGRKVGIWYALKNWRARATVKMIDDKTVNISLPLENMHKFKRRSDKD